MTTSNSRIEDALIQSLLEMSADELRTELTQLGEDPIGYLRLADAAIKSALDTAGAQRLAKAKEDLLQFRRNEAVHNPSSNIQSLSSRLIPMGNGAPGSLLAARKGKELTERDEQILSEALDDLERLSDEEPK